MKSKPTLIFALEDDPVFQRLVRYVLELNPDHQVEVFSTAEACIAQLHRHPDILTLDYSLPDMGGDQVLATVKKISPNTAILVLSGQQDVSIAIELMKGGADDYLVKDQNIRDRLLHSIEKLKEKASMRQQIEALQMDLADKFHFDNIIGDSAPMQEVYKLIRKACQSDITVSITGETGTGKEVVAKTIHYNSHRRKGPFVALNMGAIPSELLESELFGYEKGAFTGAQTRKKGQFELANGGTLFLDEITELDIHMQAKILRALQEREFLRVGGDKPVPFDVRIITASHKDMAAEVAEGRFREDLYFRLLGLRIELPPLRYRGNDIILLATHFLDSFCQANRLGKRLLSKQARKKLLEYDYPGNVRELKAIVELAAVMSDGNIIEAEDLQFHAATPRSQRFLAEELTLEQYKRLIIGHFLKKYDNDVLLVAKKLDIGKSTIYRMLKEEDLRTTSPIH